MGKFKWCATALLTALCVAIFCLPAYAMGDPALEPDGGYPSLTPEGNMTLNDDVYELIVETITQTGDDGTQVIERNVIENKQFLTVQTRSGAVFYIIIDRSLDSNNVYFLNQVDDDDLFALLEAEDSATPCTCAVKCTPGEVNTDCYVCKMNMKSCTGTEKKEEVVTPEKPEPDEPEKKTSNPMLVVLLLVVAGGGAVVFFLKKRKEKPKKPVANPDDYDMGDDESEEFEEETEDETEDEIE